MGEFIVQRRIRRRYIGYVIFYENQKPPHVTRRDMIQALQQQCMKVFNVNCKEMGIYLTRFNGERGIIRCNHLDKEKTIKLLTSIEKIGGYNVTVNTIGTSGTIKALLRKHMKQYQLK